MKKTISILCVTILILIGQGCKGKKEVVREAVTVTHFSDMYSEVLRNLLESGHTMWDGSVGSIKGDWTYDGQAFAPKALEFAGRVSEAKLVLDYNTSLQLQVTSQDLKNKTASVIEFVVGFGAYVDGLRIYPDKANWNWCNMMGLGVNVGIDLVKQDPNPVGDLNGYICGIASVVNTAYVDANACLNSQLAVKGNEAYTLLNSLYWVADKGYYRDTNPLHQGSVEFSSFQNGTALWALSWHYGIYKDADSLSKIQSLYTMSEQHLWNSTIGGYVDLMGYPGMDLGANLLWARGWIWSYAVTGDVRYLNKTEAVLNFIQSKLFVDDNDHPGFKILAHDFSIEHDAASSNYCTGCNYLALIVIQEYNERLLLGPLTGKIPITKPACGTLVSQQ